MGIKSFLKKRKRKIDKFVEKRRVATIAREERYDERLTRQAATAEKELKVLQTREKKQKIIAKVKAMKHKQGFFGGGGGPSVDNQSMFGGEDLFGGSQKKPKKKNKSNFFGNSGFI